MAIGAHLQVNERSKIVFNEIKNKNKFGFQQKVNNLLKTLLKSSNKNPHS